MDAAKVLRCRGLLAHQPPPDHARCCQAPCSLLSGAACAALPGDLSSFMAV